MAIGTVYADALESQVGVSNTQAAGNVSRSRVVVAPFIWTAASEASGTTVNLAVIPKGARLLTASVAASGTLANSAQISFGLAAKDNSGYIDDVASGSSISTAGAAVTTAQADSTTCLKAAAAQGATQVGFVLTSALGFLYETQKELYLTLTTSVGQVSTEVVRGYITYAVD